MNYCPSFAVLLDLSYCYNYSNEWLYLNEWLLKIVGKGSNVKNIAKQYIQVKLSFIDEVACLN